MAWEKVATLKGKVYVPDKDKCRYGKHPCPDCYACQGCSTERCRICRHNSAKGRQARQIPAMESHSCHGRTT